MARTSGKLTAVGVAKMTTPGMYGDGGGLWLQVSAVGAKSWILRYQMQGRNRYMGLGSCQLVTLAEARQKAIDARKMILTGTDPLADREERILTAKVERAKLVTFQQCATAYIDTHKAGWSNLKHVQQWQNTLATYAYPQFGELPVAKVDTSLVLRYLEPIWTTKPETASRVRGRIEAILDYATTRTYRQGENPARWRGHLENLLPSKTKVARVEHHAAMPFQKVAEFMVALRQQEGAAARCLEFVVLTACRTGEAIGATWQEINLETRTWTIPADRMKGEREHRVPLAEPAVILLKDMLAIRQSDFVFPGGRVGKPFSNMALLMLLRRMGLGDLTIHGFRSSFRDWAAETTGYPNEMMEMALAHAIPGKVEAAYRRGDLFDKRRRLMDDWGNYCNTPLISGSNVIPIRRQA